jgi:hypothetical protein
MGLIPPSYLELLIGDTREHLLGVYLEKESLYFNYLNLEEPIGYPAHTGLISPSVHTKNVEFKRRNLN